MLFLQSAMAFIKLCLCMAPHLGLAPFIIMGCAILKVNKTCSVLISSRECLFTQRVLLYFLVAYVLLLHFKVEEPLHLMRAPF